MARSDADLGFEWRAQSAYGCLPSAPRSCFGGQRDPVAPANYVLAYGRRGAYRLTYIIDGLTLAFPPFIATQTR